jgi:protoporphyrinogen oxidase
MTKRIGILGGGITGLTGAYYLLKQGFEVTILEGRPQVGGLAAAYDFGAFHWDKFYHCILTTDKPLLQLIDDLGLSDQMRWQETKVGFFTGSSLHSMSSTKDLLMFPGLSPWAKLRIALGVLHASRIKDGKALEAIPVADWLIKVFGRENYENMWAPLLKCKLGDARHEASAAFIWATIFRLYSTREKDASQKEKLGYVKGGYRVVFDRLIAEIQRLGGTIECGTAVRRVTARDGQVEVQADHRSYEFDQVITTIPSHLLAQIAPQLPAEAVEKLLRVKYLGIACFALLLKRSLTPYYCTNLTDNAVPFTGVIEMTNLVDREETAGRHLVYVPKYLAPGDALFNATEEDVWNTFYPHVKRMIPDLKDSDIERKFFFREKFVQPIPVLHYSDIVPEMQTAVPGLVLANSTQIINSTLNNNEMVKIAQRAVETVSAAIARVGQNEHEAVATRC